MQEFAISNEVPPKWQATSSDPVERRNERRPLHQVIAKLRRRHLLMPVILLIHLLLLTLIILSPSATAVQPAIGSPLSVFDVSSEAEKPTQPDPPPQLPDPVMPEPLVKLEVEGPPLPPPPVFDAAAAEQAGFGTSCDVTDTLARAFAQSELLKSQLARIGPQSRSVANAIMFWDQAWVDVPGRAPEDAINTLRRGILEGVRAAPPECLTQEIAGPRFISINVDDTSMVLVMGSGLWRWEQLLLTAQEEQWNGRFPTNPSLTKQTATKG